MVKVDVYNQAGDKTSSKTLNKNIFEVKVNEELIHQALVMQQANARYNLWSVKDRSAVRGGWRKPFRQKGTGRARQGTIRAPQMKGGGVVFWPSGIRNFSKTMPKKQRRVALFSALSAKAKDKQIFCLEGYEWEIKTKVFAELISNLPVDRNVLFIISEKNNTLEKSANNIQSVKTILASNINIADLLKYRKICLVWDVDKKLEEIFLK